MAMEEDNINGSSSSLPSLSELPRSLFWDSMELCNWEGFWLKPDLFKSTITFQSTFQAQDDDILLSSSMKTGTTWLKALTLCILNNPILFHSDQGDVEDILIKDNPQFHVQTIESMVYYARPHSDLNTMLSPRLFHTHLAFRLLPNSIKASGCKIVYLARNRKDTFVSLWHFLNSSLRANQDPFPLEAALDSFCNGVHLHGPFFEHVLQYWVESKKKPERILFLKYEDMKKDPHGELRKLGVFLGRPFGSDEEIEKVIWRCSLERLKGLEVNKNGPDCFIGLPNSSFFRRGVVGDWKNYLTPEMAERLDEVTRYKFEGSGLDLVDS